jgi:arylsulfatase A-like enzyme
VAGTLVQGCTTAQRPIGRPNVLLLFADDQRVDTIAAHGNPHIVTPTLDRLAASGFSFHGNYVFGGDSGAVCVASRAMLMTGRTWFDIDTRTLADTTLLPSMLAAHGYETFGTGKWHNGTDSFVRAFERGRTVMFGGMSDHTLVPVRDLAADRSLTPPRTGDRFSSEMFVDSAIEFIQSHDETKPFFAYVAFTAPHDPGSRPSRFVRCTTAACHRCLGTSCRNTRSTTGWCTTFATKTSARGRAPKP